MMKRSQIFKYANILESIYRPRHQRPIKFNRCYSVEANKLTSISSTKKLVKHDGMALVSMEDVLQSAKIVAYYFSASWCSHCIELLPKIRKAYKENLEKHLGFVIIYISFDKNKGEMEAYYRAKHGSWYMIPFGDTAIVGLADRFDIEGVPHVIVCNMSGKIITKKGRQEIHANGINAIKSWVAFPNGMESLYEQTLWNGDLKPVNFKKIIKDKKLLLLYFSSVEAVHQDEKFSSLLKKVYHEANTRNVGLEIIFVSSDETKEAMVSFFKTKQGPWYAVPFGSNINKELQLKYNVTSMPQVIVIKLDTGQIISRNGKGEIDKLGVNVLVTWSG